MKKSYLLAPLIALLVFGGFYWNFTRTHAAEVEFREKAKKDELAAKLAAEDEARRKAFADAIALQEQRKTEREAREAAEKLRKERLETALDARLDAFQRQEKSARQVERLKKQLAEENEQIARLERERAAALAEKTFLAGYVTQAAQNRASLLALADKLTAPAAPTAKK